MVDYIVVGAGSAGCVVASRLSEDPDVRVLLLEAGGPDESPAIHIPAAFSRLFQTEADWNYRTAPQRGAAGRALYWPRGKVLGGSSSINAMIYVRGHRDDYDGWAAAGCEGWGYDDVLPLFKRSEDFSGGASTYHGVGGPMHVEARTDASPISEAFVEAAAAVGHPLTDDFNGAQQRGAGLYALTRRRGRRVSAATAFLAPARSRPNLVVRTHAHVHRVVVRGGRAVAVEVARKGRVETIRAEREIVLCGGAVNSPQLLMLSGIGPARHLTELGLEVVLDRPEVGENLQDHLIVGLHHRLRGGRSLRSAEGVGSVLDYLVRRRGLLTSNVAEAGLFMASGLTSGAPDLQFHMAPGHFVNHGLDPISDHGFSIGPTLVRPQSRGRITLESADPESAPRIDPRALAEPADLDVLVAGLEAAREIAEAAPLDRHRAGRLDPGPASFARDDLERYVRETCETLYHPVGTCRMGADDGSVVDPELRVRGVEALRVADASVMPAITNGNTNAPSILIGERAADLVRASTGRALEA